VPLPHRAAVDPFPTFAPEFPANPHVPRLCENRIKSCETEGVAERIVLLSARWLTAPTGGHASA
jgi:hypothetical protein